MAENNSILDKLEGLVSRYEEVGTLITDPNVISDQKRYVKLTKEYKDLGDIMKARKEYMDSLQTLQDAKEMLATEDDPEMKEMAREEMAAAEKHIPEMEERIKLLLVPADPEDDKNVIMEIRGGTGGDEAALFAGDLFRMYTKYCEMKGWKIAISSFTEGAAGGFKEIIFSVTGEKVYGTLKYESGVHRVQRVPATETQGRVHTSAATVAVLPEAQEFDVEINEGEIKWDTFRSSGAGGQNVNKVESGVRARYLWKNPNTGETEEILAYLEGDRDWLTSIAEEQIPVCLEDLEQYHDFREQIWFHECKPNGYETIDIRLGGLHARLVSAQKRILAYLADEITEIPELLEERLPYKPSAPEGLQQPFNMSNWLNIVTAGNMGTGTV